MASSWVLCFIVGSPLPVLPIFTRAFDVRILRPLIATAQQQHDLLARDCVVHPIAWANFDPKFPNAVATKLVIAKIAKRYPVDPSINGNPGSPVAQLARPVDVRVQAIRRYVVKDFEHGEYSSMNEFLSTFQKPYMSAPSKLKPVPKHLIPQQQRLIAHEIR